MFSGIVETTGKVVSIDRDKGNIHFTIETSLGDQLKIDQSMSHDGVCLTVVKVMPEKKQYVVTAIQETLDKTCLSEWKLGYEVNLERSVVMGGRLDGHVVQGHVDQTAVVKLVEETEGSWRYVFEYDTTVGNITVEKGSISINGVSLTVFDCTPGSFAVAIIPYTYHETNFHNFQVGSVVNLEFDVFGKYVARLLEQYMAAQK